MNTVNVFGGGSRAITQQMALKVGICTAARCAGRVAVHRIKRSQGNSRMRHSLVNPGPGNDCRAAQATLKSLRGNDTDDVWC